MAINVYRPSQKVPTILVRMKSEFSRQIFQKLTNIKFQENPSSGSRVFPCGRTDGHTDTANLIIAFRNFANTLKNEFRCKYRKFGYIK
jgi:hypothetical protein